MIRNVGHATHRTTDSKQEGSPWWRPALGTYAIVQTYPILYIALSNGTYLLWPLSALWLASQCPRIAQRHRIAATMLAGTLGLGNLALLASLYMQGTGFNDRFAYHANTHTARMALDAYPVESLACILYLLCVCAGPVLIARIAPTPNRLKTRTRVALTILAGMTWGPAVSIATYAQGSHTRAEPTIDAVALHALAQRTLGVAPSTRAPGEQRSLVLVIGESLEATLSDPEVMGADRTPRLTKLAHSGARFTHMEEIAGTGWTMGALVAAQCGRLIPMGAHMATKAGASLDRPTSSDVISALKQFKIADSLRYWLSEWSAINTLTGAIAILPDTRCLGDILAGKGYRTVFLAGDSLDFAGRRRFLENHGYDVVHGMESLSPSIVPESKVGPWGIYDTDLFDIARVTHDRLADDDRPYVLIVLTSDTHDLGRRWRTAPQCGVRPIGMPIDAWQLDCADRLVSRFIARARLVDPDAVIALLSDHLIFTGPLAKTIGAHAQRRLLRFALWSDPIGATVITHRGTHLDVAPTLLDAMGHAGYQRIGNGHSLLRKRDTEPTSHPVPALTIRLKRNDVVTFEAAGEPTVRIGDRILRANWRGKLLQDRIFTMQFDPEGHFQTLLPHQHLDELTHATRGTLVVGISGNREFNAALGEAREPHVAFVGQLDSTRCEERLAIAPIHGRVDITLTDTLWAQSCQGEVP